MIVNKCDNCGTVYEEGAYPNWLQITSEKGILVVNATRQVVKYSMLDFCNNNCLANFFCELGESMKESSCQSKSEE